MYRTSRILLRSLLLLNIVALSLVEGCTVWRQPSMNLHNPAQALPQQYQAYYDYPASALLERNLQTKENKNFVVQTVEFDLALPAPLKVQQMDKVQKELHILRKHDPRRAKDLELLFTNRIDLYIPKNINEGEKRPLVLVSPILGGNFIVDWFAEYYARKGYLAAMVYRKHVFWDDDKGMEQFEEYLRSSVIRLRQALDWLEIHPHVDTERIGAFGISYGAILHAILAAVEPRIKYHILALAAAPLPEVLVNCPETSIIRLVNRINQKYGWSKEKIKTELKNTLKTDPIFLAPHIPHETVTYYYAVFDRVVGAKHSRKLWKTMGKPDLKVLPFGHYGSILLYPYLRWQSFHILKKHLE